MGGHIGEINLPGPIWLMSPQLVSRQLRLSGCLGRNSGTSWAGGVNSSEDSLHAWTAEQRVQKVKQ